MLANVDTIISIVAVIIAIGSTQPWKSCCVDLLLFFATVFGYALLARHLRKWKAVPTTKSVPKEVSCDHQIHEDVKAHQLEPAANACPAEDAVQDEQLDLSSSLKTMREHAARRDISSVMKIFLSIKQRVGHLSSDVYNVILQAWVNCGNIPAAEELMEEMQRDGMADEASFELLVRAHVATHNLHKARSVMNEMKSIGAQPTLASFNKLLSGYAQEGLFDEGLHLMEELCAQGVQPNFSTSQAMMQLINGARIFDQGSQDDLRNVLAKYQLGEYLRSRCFQPSMLSPQQQEFGAFSSPLLLPTLVSAMKLAEHARMKSYFHEIHMAGPLARVKAARRTLKQHGFLDEGGDSSWPLDGHWETGHGLTVFIEGKIVRWSRHRASRLKLGHRRRSCELMLYGTPTQGQVATPGTAPGAAKTLSWENGDVWHSYDGRAICQSTLYSQSMTKILRDVTQDELYRAKAYAIVNCTSVNGLGLPSSLLDTIIQYLGGDLYYIRIRFESSWCPSTPESCDPEEADILALLSQRNPRVGLRHCWVKHDDDNEGPIGQRTLVNGEEVDEEVFCRHIQAVV